MISTQRAAVPSVAPQSGNSPSGSGEEHTLHSERIQIERKTFTLSLRENPRGRFLRITEDVAGRHDTIIVPAPGLPEFLRVLAQIARQAESGEGAGAQTLPSEPA